MAKMVCGDHPNCIIDVKTEGLMEMLHQRMMPGTIYTAPSHAHCERNFTQMVEEKDRVIAELKERLAERGRRLNQYAQVIDSLSNQARKALNLPPV